MPALLALIAVTAVWGVTFVQVKDAVALYPLFAFLAVRFAIASLALAVPAAGGCGRSAGRGWVAGSTLGLLLAPDTRCRRPGSSGRRSRAPASSPASTSSSRRCSRCSSSGRGSARAVWIGVALGGRRARAAVRGRRRRPVGDLLVLGGSAVYSLQIVLMERFAPRYDPIAFTQAEMLAAFAGFAVVAVALGQVEVPHGWTVWGALLVTGVFASALGFLVQTWAQRRTSATTTALAFAMEPVWAGIFGFWLAGDRLGAIGWAGCAVIMAGIVVAEPAAGETLRGSSRAAPSGPAAGFTCRAQISQAPSRWTSSPSTCSSPPGRRSLTMSQCTALSFLPPL